jgi:hypothetical protein
MRKKSDIDQSAGLFEKCVVDVVNDPGRGKGFWFPRSKFGIGKFGG